MNKVNYFGYGANRDQKMIAAITGLSETELEGRGYPAILEGYSLALQRLDQVTDVVAEGMPTSPRDVLAENWGEDFTSYVIVSNPEGKVAGTVWELTPEERERIRDWELVDLGWYEDYEAEITTPEGERISVIGEKLPDDQSIDHRVDGMNYETWLNDPEMFERVATRVRKEFDERNKPSNPEGGAAPTSLRN